MRKRFNDDKAEKSDCKSGLWLLYWTAAEWVGFPMPGLVVSYSSWECLRSWEIHPPPFFFLLIVHIQTSRKPYDSALKVNKKSDHSHHLPQASFKACLITVFQWVWTNVNSHFNKNHKIEWFHQYPIFFPSPQVPFSLPPLPAGKCLATTDVLPVTIELPFLEPLFISMESFSMYPFIYGFFHLAKAFETHVLCSM